MPISPQLLSQWAQPRTQPVDTFMSAYQTGQNNRLQKEALQMKREEALRQRQMDWNKMVMDARKLKMDEEAHAADMEAHDRDMTAPEKPLTDVGKLFFDLENAGSDQEKAAIQAKIDSLGQDKGYKTFFRSTDDEGNVTIIGVTEGGDNKTIGSYSGIGPTKADPTTIVMPAATVPVGREQEDAEAYLNSRLTEENGFPGGNDMPAEQWTLLTNDFAARTKQYAEAENLDLASAREKAWRDIKAKLKPGSQWMGLDNITTYNSGEVGDGQAFDEVLSNAPEGAVAVKTFENSVGERKDFYVDKDDNRIAPVK